MAQEAILPKLYVKNRYSKIQSDWPCYGVPEKLVCDRGPDLTSKDLEHAAFQLNLELDFNPPRTPHFKGTVESFFDSLNDQLIASLPARTFRSWERRADYKADDGPFISYESLVEVIHIHLIDVYSVAKHPTSMSTRLEMWQESAAEFPPCLPASPDDLVVLLSKRVERKLSSRGIELNGMFYNSDELMALRAELAANNAATDRFQIRYNPWDLGHAWVLNPLDKRYLKIAAADSTMVEMTEFQWRVLRRAVRERFDRPEHLLSLAAGRNAIRDVVEQAVTKPSRQRRVKAARFLGRSTLTNDDRSSPSDDRKPNDSLCDERNPPPVDNAVSERPYEDTVSPSSPLIEVDADDLDVDDWEVACE